VADFVQIFQAHRQRVQKFSANGVWGVRVIHRKKDVVRSDHLHCAQQGRYGEVAAIRDIEVFLKVFAKPPLEMAYAAREHGFGARNREGQVLAHVPDNDV